ncbi:autoinducer binding domain-containing protein [Burkholderia ubonensis]|uniref:HTH luxR-type domain-containing protein n=1 Tax=Burkholderia ubonensis TaxID=101571 RepID=A0A1R1JBQ7_9BURK|nr:autoinducer binding domain-containing protein [Burkholderia ubonensis]OMG72766.1 hypothetical protein BW685_13785 [Burkholderia ubonensis]
MREESKRLTGSGAFRYVTSRCRCDERILETILEIERCDCVDELQRVLMSVGRMVGFDYACYQDFHLKAGKVVAGRTLSNFPASWWPCYHEAGYLDVDPVVRHALSSLAPLTWCDGLFVTREQRALRADHLAHGLWSGVSFPAHNRHGDVACVSFVFGSPEHDDGGIRNDMLSRGALVANLTLEAMRKSRPKGAGQEVPCLTARELEILAWVAEGKSSWDISRIVSLSEHGVLHHIRSVMKKFDVPTRRQAVLMASRLGML